MTTIYNYNPNNGALLSQGTARVSPLEPDVFLIPANATTVAPPTSGTNQVAVFENNAWSLQPDFRGQVQYNTTTAQASIVNTIGTLAEGETLLVPPQYPLWSNGAWTTDNNAWWSAIRAQRTATLNACDWTQGADSPLSSDTKAAWAAYRTALRNLPATYAQSGPGSVIWPSQPS